MGPTRCRRGKPRIHAQLPLFRHGGARRGAGRKSKCPRDRTPHRERQRVARGTVVSVTVRLLDGLASLRRPEEFDSILRSIHAAQRSDFRVIHGSAQPNHLHLLAESAGTTALSSGMNGLLVRIARSLNRLWNRRGPIFADRYHARVLRTPREVRNVLVYVLQNASKHGTHLAGPDPFSSAPWFDGWRGTHPSPATPSPFAPAQTWLATVGWRRHGRIGLDEVPRAAPTPRPDRSTPRAGS